ncbi:MAG: ABC transporter permease [Deltaproteobacteria bacterium]|nr:ABC transporter permease [Deltaproteobacteria bacterium]
MIRLVEAVGRAVTNVVEGFGHFAILAGETLRSAVRPPFRFRLLLHALEFAGVGSLFIILLCGTFIGMVFALQAYHGFGLFGAEELVGGTVGVSLAREIGPVFTAVVFTARGVSAMATEIGTMRVTEQIDALQAMAVNPVQYLIVPRVVASVIMVPVLAMVFMSIGMVGAYFVGVILMGLDEGAFIAQAKWWVDAYDITNGITKAAVFGLITSFIGCYQGFRAQGGARGVGIATTRAVVSSVVAIILSDYFLTVILFAASRKDLG